MNVSKHFTLKELTASQTATRLKIKEQFTPPLSVVANLHYLAELVLEPIRQHYGPIFVSSAYRCAALNKAVKGSKSSFHLTGCAADIDFGSVEKNRELFNWIKENLPFTELIDEYGFDWVHVAIAAGRESEKAIKVIK